MESPDQFLSRPVQNFSATEETEIEHSLFTSLLLDQLSSSFRKEVDNKQSEGSAHIQTIFT